MTLTAAAARSYLIRRRDDPLRFFRPVSEQQRLVVEDAGKGVLAIGGNRAGKTYAGAVKTALMATGRFPDRKQAKLIWCISQELPGTSERPHVQLEALKSVLPRDVLQNASFAASYRPSERVLVLTNGCVVQFKSYDQDPLSFESQAVDFIWFDEEPTRREIFNSCLLRLVDRRGCWLMTMTPILSLQGNRIVAEELWEHRAEAERSGQYRVYQLLTSENRYLPEEEVKRLSYLPEEERVVRLEGAFARLGGRVLSEFDPDRHLVDDFLPPPSWRHCLAIDPGWNTAAHLFSATDPDGRIWFYAEHYAGEMTPEQHVGVVAAMWDAFCSAWGSKPEIEVIMDPAGFHRKRATTGRESPGDQEEYVLAALARVPPADWLYPVPADNSDPYAWRLKRYLAADLLKVCKGLRWWRWEQERWTRQKERHGPLSLERPVPDRPVDRYNHHMDLSRYIVNMRYDPVLIGETSPVPGSLNDYLRRKRARLDEADRLDAEALSQEITFR